MCVPVSVCVVSVCVVSVCVRLCVCVVSVCVVSACVRHTLFQRVKTTAGGSSPLMSLLPTKLLMSWEDITADHRDAPADQSDLYNSVAPLS